LRWQREIYEADLDTEGKLEQVYLQPLALPTRSISSDDDTDSTEKLGSEYYLEPDSDEDMGMEDDGDALYSVDLDSDVNMERDGDYEEEEKEEEDEEE